MLIGADTAACVANLISAQLLYLGGSLGPPHDELRRSKGSQPVLWAHGISGDNPIVLVGFQTVAFEHRGIDHLSSGTFRNAARRREAPAV